MMVLAVVSLLFLLMVVGLSVVGQNTTTRADPLLIPAGNQLRSNGKVAVSLTDASATTMKPGVHRYEIILARLRDDAGGSTAVSSTKTGTIILETYDHWAPIGVAHFDKLVENKFYDACRIFRVVKNFVVQFGINGDPAVQAEWRKDVLKDDPVVETNAYGTLTYATSGPNSRTVQLFINTNPKGNARLDGMGFAPFGRIVQGMDEYVTLINSEYGEKPNQGKIQNQGNVYLDQEFPRLSYIESIRRVGETPN
eukprot:scaffold15966_cov249-Amphora_coffeaeformis.AAC.2